MPVSQADISLKRSETNNDVAAQNGGRLTDTTLTQTFFPDVSGTERAAGLTRYRKLFAKNEAGTGTLPLKYSDDTLSLLSAKAYMENISSAGDHFKIKAATATDVQSNIVDSGWAGTGYLEANVSVAATTCQIRCEIDGATGELFQVGGTMILTDYINGIGNREFLTIDSVTWGAGADANRATIVFASTPLQNAYTRNALAADRTADIFSTTTIGYTSDTMDPDALIGRRVHIKSGTGAGQWRRIIDNTVTTITVEYPWSTTPSTDSVYEVVKTYGCMCVALGDIKCAYNTVVVTSASGTFDDTAMKLFPVGTRDESWTLLFTGATTFTISGSYYTVAGTFSTGSITRPANGASSFFEIPIAAWGGTFTNGDTVTFNTVSASKAFWVRERLEADIDPHLANSIDIGFTGDTV